MTTLPPLPDVNALLADLEPLVQLESPSSDLEAVRQVQDAVGGLFGALGASAQTLPGEVRRFRLGTQDRPTLILMHADTVWPHGTLQTMPWRVEGERAYGPGGYDMKGGVVSALHALRLVRAQLDGQWPQGGVELLLTADEEVGSRLSRPAIEAAAREARRVLVVEPPVADTHALKTGRKGVGDYLISVRGVAAHAGNRPADGASAISEAARLVGEAQALARPELGTTVSVGRVSGGGAVNVIPAHAELALDVRVSTLAEGERVQRGLEALRAADPRARVTLSGGLNRPPFERLPGTARLFAQARGLAAQLGFTVDEAVVGGGSDGNFTAPLSPTLDGLGAPGDGAHAAHEHIRLDRWPQQVQLLAALLAAPERLE